VVVPHIGFPATAGAESGPDRRQFLLRHVGKLFSFRDISGFIEGVRSLLCKRPEARDYLVVEFVGYCAPSISTVIRAAKDLEPVVRLGPPTSLRRALELISEADVLLLVEPPRNIGVTFPAKFADYLAARKPILALSPKVGTVADMLADGGGILVRPDDSQGIAQALERLYLSWRDATLSKFAPPAHIADHVTAETAVRCYEAAFQLAIRNAPKRRRNT